MWDDNLTTNLVNPLRCSELLRCHVEISHDDMWELLMMMIFHACDIVGFVQRLRERLSRSPDALSAHRMARAFPHTASTNTGNPGPSLAACCISCSSSSRRVGQGCTDLICGSSHSELLLIHPREIRRIGSGRCGRHVLTHCSRRCTGRG